MIRNRMLLGGISIFSASVLGTFLLMQSETDRTIDSSGTNSSLPNQQGGAHTKSAVARAAPTVELSSNSAEPEKTVISISNAPPSMLPGQTKYAEAEYASEPLDYEWSSRMSKELADSLSVMEEAVESAQIDCRSSTCRVELRSRTSDSYEERSARARLWIDEVVRRTGFLRGDTEFFPDEITSLSYFSMKTPKEPEIPADLPPKVRESMMRSMQERQRQLRQRPAQDAGAPAIGSASQ